MGTRSNIGDGTHDLMFYEAQSVRISDKASYLTAKPFVQLSRALSTAHQRGKHVYHDQLL